MEVPDTHPWVPDTMAARVPDTMAARVPDTMAASDFRTVFWQN